MEIPNIVGRTQFSELLSTLKILGIGWNSPPQSWCLPLLQLFNHKYSVLNNLAQNHPLYVNHGRFSLESLCFGKIWVSFFPNFRNSPENTGQHFIKELPLPADWSQSSVFLLFKLQNTLPPCAESRDALRLIVHGGVLFLLVNRGSIFLLSFQFTHSRSMQRSPICAVTILMLHRIFFTLLPLIFMCGFYSCFCYTFAWFAVVTFQRQLKLDQFLRKTSLVNCCCTLIFMGVSETVGKDAHKDWIPFQY